MADFTYHPQAAIDIATGNLVAVQTAGQAFAVSDTARSSPLSVRLPDGTYSTSIPLGAQTAQFVWEDGEGEVQFVVGGVVCWLFSLDGYAAAASEAITAANQALAIAQQVVADGGGGGGGTSDHGALSGLGDDDHPQYLTQSRADTRYYTKPQTESAIAAAQQTQSDFVRNRANHTGSQGIGTIIGLRAELDALASSGGGGTGAVASVNGKTGAVVLTKTDLGLGLVQNVTPADMPVSNATQEALNKKAAATHTHSAAEAWLVAALANIPRHVRVFTGDEPRPTGVDFVIWVAQPGYSGGAPAAMAAGDEWHGEGI